MFVFHLFAGFLQVSDMSVNALERKTGLACLGNSRLKKDEFHGLRDSIRSQQLSDKMLQD